MLYTSDTDKFVREDFGQYCLQEYDVEENGYTRQVVKRKEEERIGKGLRVSKVKKITVIFIGKVDRRDFLLIIPPKYLDKNNIKSDKETAYCHLNKIFINIVYSTQF